MLIEVHKTDDYKKVLKFIRVDNIPSSEIGFNTGSKSKYIYGTYDGVPFYVNTYFQDGHIWSTDRDIRTAIRNIVTITTGVQDV